jgi:hypothetical protein
MVAMLVAGCSKDETAESPFKGSDNSIVAFTLEKDGITLKGALTPDAIVITAPERFSLSGATATVVFSENATIEPDPATVTDWDAAQTFTVTSYNGTGNTYAYSVERHLVSREGDVVLLTQADVEAFAAELEADQLNGTLTVGAANGEDTVYSLAPLAGRLKIITGGIIINNTYAGEDLSGLSDNVEKTGDLTVTSKIIKTVSFPKLTTVRLTFYINQATAVSSLNFPELVTVDKAFQIAYPDSLVSVSFPKLEQVLEGFTVLERSGANAVHTVQTLGFPALKRIGGTATVSYLRKLAGLDFPELVSTGAFTMNNMDSLKYFTVPRLETINGTISISSCGGISELRFSALKTLNGSMSLSLSKLDYLFCPLLERIAGSVPQLPPNPEVKFPLVKTVDGSLYFTIDSNPLTAFPLLDSVGTINIGSGNYDDVTLDLRGIKVGTLSSGATGRIILLGDEVSYTSFEGSSFPFVIQEGFKTIGRLYLNNTNFTSVDFSWFEHIRNDIYFYYQYNIEELEFPNLKSAGGINIVGNNKLKTFSMPKLETITGYTDTRGNAQGGFVYTVSSDIASVELPALKSIVGDVSITGLAAARPLETIDFSSLQSITGKLTVSGTNNAAFKDLSKFGALTSAAGVTIAGFTQLNDFEPLKNVIPSLSADTWAVGGCGYNPTYQDMTDGKYKQP